MVVTCDGCQDILVMGLMGSYDERRRAEIAPELLPTILDRINGISSSGTSSSCYHTIQAGYDNMAPQPTTAGAASACEVMQPGESNSIVVSDDLPPSMKRQCWSVKDFNLLRQVHRGSVTSARLLCILSSNS